MTSSIKLINLKNVHELDLSSPEWKVEKKEKIFRESIFDLQKEISISPQTGQAHEFVTLDASDWVMVIPFVDDQDIVMVSQYRHGAKMVSLEFPGGIVDPGEIPIEAVSRELLEETGLVADKLVEIGKIYANPAFMNNRCHFFAAINCQRKNQKLTLDANEELMPLRIKKTDIKGFIQKGYMINSMCICGCYYFDQFMTNNKGISTLNR